MSNTVVASERRRFAPTLQTVNVDTGLNLSGRLDGTGILASGSDIRVGGRGQTRYNGAREGPCRYLKDTLMHRDCDLPL